jgi:hypothetical protein
MKHKKVIEIPPYYIDTLGFLKQPALPGEAPQKKIFKNNSKK